MRCKCSQCPNFKMMGEIEIASLCQVGEMFLEGANKESSFRCLTLCLGGRSCFASPHKHSWWNYSFHLKEDNSQNLNKICYDSLTLIKVWTHSCWRTTKSPRCKSVNWVFTGQLESSKWDFWPIVYLKLGFPGGASGKESACQCRRHKRCGFDPWVENIPWRTAWKPTPVFLPGESHGQMEAGRLQSIGSQRIRHD